MLMAGFDWVAPGRAIASQFKWNYIIIISLEMLLRVQGLFTAGKPELELTGAECESTIA